MYLRTLGTATRWAFLGGSLLSSTGCGDGASITNDSGNLSVLLEAESTIVEGVAAGDGDEQIADGWNARFDRFLVAIGDVRAELASDRDQVFGDERIVAVDLTKIPSNGKTLWHVDGLPAERYQFGYRVADANAVTSRDSSVSKADLETMKAGDWSHLVTLVLSKTDGVSCPPESRAQVDADTPSVSESSYGVACYANPEIRVELGMRALAVYGPCERDGVAGFSIPAGGEKTVAATLHGDHLFFNGFPEGDEGGIHRYAQWLADCDLNVDGNVTLDELDQLAPSDLAELDDRYQLGGAPLEVRTLRDYAAAQLMTQGHFEGEGECTLSDVEQ